MHTASADNRPQVVKPIGRVDIVLTGPDGAVKDGRKKCNMVVATGLQYLASRLIGAAGSTALSHIAVGTGTTPAATGQTALATELARTAIGASSIVTTAVANDSVMFTATFSPGVATGPITETGMLDAATGGTLFSRTVFDVINKGASDTLTITWIVQFS